MASGKVVVHGVPTNSGDSTSPEDFTKKIRNDLTQLLKKYGPVTCVYVGSDETSHITPSPEKKMKTKEAGEEQSNLAHMMFENAEDAAKAYQAAVNHEIKLGDNVLTLTLTSKSSVTINDLDDKSLINIFLMLNPKAKLAIEEVCKRWKKLMKHIWPHTRILRLGGIDFPEAKFRKYLKRCGRYLEVLKCDVSSPTFLDLILKHCKRLKTLELDIYLVDSETTRFHNMFKGLKHLRTLKLDHQDKLFQLDFVESLPKSMEKICLSCCSGSNGFIDFDLSRFPNLQSLYLSGYEIYGRDLENIERLKHLTHVEFDDCLTYRSITRKLENFTSLKTLKIPKSGITDDILIKILKNNRGLESLDISKSPALTDRSVRMSSTLANLKVLNVSKLSVTFSFVDQMPSLEELKSEECKNLTNVGVGRLIGMAPKLRLINVCDSSITKDLFSIANAALKQRDTEIGLTIVTTETSEEWKSMEDLSPLLKIQRSGGKKDWDYLLLYGIHDDSDDDLNDERQYSSSSSDEHSDDY